MFSTVILTHIYENLSRKSSPYFDFKHFGIHNFDKITRFKLSKCSHYCVLIVLFQILGFKLWRWFTRQQNCNESYLCSGMFISYTIYLWVSITTSSDAVISGNRRDIIQRYQDISGPGHLGTPYWTSRHWKFRYWIIKIIWLNLKTFFNFFLHVDVVFFGTE